MHLHVSHFISILLFKPCRSRYKVRCADFHRFALVREVTRVPHCHFVVVRDVYLLFILKRLDDTGAEFRAPDPLWAREVLPCLVLALFDLVDDCIPIVHTENWGAGVP